MPALPGTNRTQLAGTDHLVFHRAVHPLRQGVCGYDEPTAAERLIWKLVEAITAETGAPSYQPVVKVSIPHATLHPLGKL